MTWEEIQDLTLARVGEVGWFTATLSNPTVAPLDVVRPEVEAAYGDALNVLKESGAFPTEDQDDFTFPADTEYIDLTGASYLNIADPKPRAWLFIGVYPNNNTSVDPHPVHFPRRGNRRRARRSMRWPRYWYWYPPYRNRSQGFFKGYYEFGFICKPTQDIEMHAMWAPGKESVNWASHSSTSPNQLPAEHHEYIAQLAAYNILGGEDGSGRMVAARLNILEERLRQSARQMNKFSYTIPGI